MSPECFVSAIFVKKRIDLLHKKILEINSFKLVYVSSRRWKQSGFHRGGHDEIVYSLLRVRDAALAQELWIRLEEGETTFAEAGAQFSEGPEAARKGVIGPQPMAQLQPHELAELLRSLRPGELHPPRRLGEWSVLVRLEQLIPARFDAEMQQRLLDQQLRTFLEERVQQRLAGKVPDPLHYAPDSDVQP